MPNIPENSWAGERLSNERVDGSGGGCKVAGTRWRTINGRVYAEVCEGWADEIMIAVQKYLKAGGLSRCTSWRKPADGIRLIPEMRSFSICVKIRRRKPRKRLVWMASFPPNPNSATEATVDAAEHLKLVLVIAAGAGVIIRLHGYCYRYVFGIPALFICLALPVLLLFG